MTEPIRSPAGHTVSESTINGSGPGVTAGVIGRDVHQGDIYQTTNNHIYVNGHPYDRKMVEARVNALVTDHPARVYDSLSKEGDERYRRLLLRSLPPAFSARVVRVMVQRPDGLVECARRYLGPMDSAHALPLLAALEPTDQAKVIAQMEPQDAGHLIADLARQPAGAPRAAQLVAAIATMNSMSAGGPEFAAAILPMNPEVLSSLPAEPAITDTLAAWGEDIGTAFDALDEEIVRAHLPGLAARKPAVVSSLLARADIHQGVLSWLDHATRKELAAVVATLPPDGIVRLLADLAPLQAVRVLVTAPADRWLTRIERSRAAVLLETLAEKATQRATAELSRYPPEFGADMIGRMTPERARGLLGALPWWMAIVLTAELSRAQPERAARLLDAVGGGRPGLGTWPAWLAAKVAIQAAPHYAAVAQGGRRPPDIGGYLRTLGQLWLVVRHAASRWTQDLRPRRRRDVAFAGAGAAVTAIAASVINLAGSGTAAPSPRTATPTSTSTGATPAGAGGPPRFPSDLAVMADRSRWTAEECPGWSEHTEIREADRVVLLRLVCTVQANPPATQVAYLQYPPDGLAFYNRPTTQYPVPAGSPGATVHRIVTPALHPGAPSWSTAGGRHGTFIEYLPDRHKSAIWLEEAGTPAKAMILFGPDPSGMSEADLRELFIQLEKVLTDHGYLLGGG